MTPQTSAVRPSTYKWWAFAALAVGLFATVADHGGVAVALPSIADYFSTDLPTVQWVVLGYALTISALLLPMGRLSDIVGRKRVYLAGFAIFVIFGALAGSSTSVLVLILSKVLQGVGAAMTQGTSMAMILTAFPNDERGKALGLQISVVGTGGVAGLALGGLLVSALGWRSVFYGSAVLGLLAIVVGLMVLEGGRTGRRVEERPSFDWLGAALSTGALVSLLLGMTAGSSNGWDSPAIALAMLSFVGLLGAFVWWELRTTEPMLDLRLFRRKLFSLGIAASFISFLGISTVRFLMPFYLQAVLGYTPGQIGLIILPSALCMTIVGPLSGRLSDRYGWRTFNVGGLALSAMGLFLLATLRETSSLGLVMAGMVVQSIGSGIFNAPNNSSILSTVEQSRYGVVSGFLNLVRNSANVTGVAVATALVTTSMGAMGYMPSLASVSEDAGAGVLGAFAAGLRTAYLVMGGLAVVGMGASFMKGGARPSPRKPGPATA